MYYLSGLGMVPEQSYYQQRGDGFLVAGELLRYIASTQGNMVPHEWTALLSFVF